MSITRLRTASALIALAACLPLAALAAARPFVGPVGWDHTVGLAATAQSPRSSETWHKSDGELITSFSDATLSYDDSIAAIHKNVADNGLKPAVDRDRTCGGSRAHEVEMTFGTTIVHQIVVDDAPGLTKITYSRPSGMSPSVDETTSVTAYCGAGT
jgi:hypothetical protein